MSETDKKQCSKCNKILELIYYEFSKPGILRNKCKICRFQETKENRNKNKDKILLIQQSIKNKVCIQCNEDKDISHFTKLITNNTGYCSYCKDCVRINRKKENKSEITLKELRCKECNIIKSISEFKKSKNGTFYTCNGCWKKPEWNKEKQRASEKKYVENNIEKIREKWRKQSKNLNRRLRNSLNKRIKACLFSKKSGTLEYTGCSIEYLKLWFEYNFEEGMSWDNYGQWHIDHITPCVKFDFSNEIDINNCFSWKNLRPCWALDNIIKGDKIDNNLIANFNKRALDFETQNPLLN